MLRYHDALMHLVVEDGEVRCADGKPFNSYAYSRFKYGHVPPSVEYGAGLARLIWPRLAPMAIQKPTVIISAPYKYVPTASHGIALTLGEALEKRCRAEGITPPVLVPFRKSQPGTSKYAKSNQQERERTLKTLGLSIDHDIRDTNVLVVDDIRITGTAEASTAAFIEPLRPHSVWYLHAACMSDAAAQAHPAIEDELNQTAPKNLLTILKDYREGTFRLNARVLGYMMIQLNKVTYYAFPPLFIHTAPTDFLAELYVATIQTGETFMARFPHALRHLARELKARGESEKLDTITA